MNESSEILHSIDELPMLMKRLFDYEVDIYDAIELLPLILRRTGSIATKAFLFQGTIEDFELNLPANVYAIHHVSDRRPMSYYSSFISSSDYRYLVNYRFDQTGNIGLYNDGNTSAEEVGEDAEAQVYEMNRNVFSLPLGSLLPFTNDNNHCLNFNWKSRDVDVLYWGAVVDGNGYFKLPEKTFEAVAYYLHYIEMRKRYNRKQADRGMLDVAEKDKNQALGAARTPTTLSVNQTDMILNAWTSFNRKRHNRQMRTF